MDEEDTEHYRCDICGLKPRGDDMFFIFPAPGTVDGVDCTIWICDKCRRDPSKRKPD